MKPSEPSAKTNPIKPNYHSPFTIHQSPILVQKARGKTGENGGISGENGGNRGSFGKYRGSFGVNQGKKVVAHLSLREPIDAFGRNQNEQRIQNTECRNQN
jgi:hypothetical protein